LETQYLIIVIAAVAAVVFLVITMYNGLVSLRNKVREAFSTMDVYLKKRFDLIPNLVAVVKGYASHEAETLERVTEMRTKAKGLSSQIEGEQQITEALAKVMAVVEAYPELRADKQFQELQQQLVQIEEDIASARRYYNGAVREFNNHCETIPNNIIASIAGFKPQPMFEAKADERTAVKVEV